VTFRDVVRPQDALLAFGDTTSNGLGVIASSNTNTFDEVLSGVSITIKKISTDPVTINVGRNDASVGDAVQKFVDDFNTLRDRIDALTSFNETTGETGVLFGDSSLLRVETELANLLSGRLFGAGSIQSLETLGISLEGNGHLSFDRGRLDSQLASNPDAVKEFLTTKDFGLSDRLESVIDQLAAGENSLLINRLESLLRTIEQNNERIETMNERLERSRERLLEEFIRLESNIARIQSGLTALQAIQPLAPL
jgi:flagellar hook-associated protein 2